MHKTGCANHINVGLPEGPIVQPYWPYKDDNPLSRRKIKFSMCRVQCFIYNRGDLKRILQCLRHQFIHYIQVPTCAGSDITSTVPGGSHSCGAFLIAYKLLLCRLVSQKTLHYFTAPLLNVFGRRNLATQMCKESGYSENMLNEFLWFQEHSSGICCWLKSGHKNAGIRVPTIHKKG